MSGHIKITVDGTTTPLVIDPTSWREVDMVDFAPRAVAGTPAFSRQGIYLDIGQQDFKHGFGQWRFREPQSYAYSGHLIDTRHGYISLYSAPHSPLYSGAGWTVRKMLVHNDRHVFITSSGIGIIRPSNGEFAYYSTYFRDMISNGTYLFVSYSGQLRIADVNRVSSSTNNTLTVDDAAWGTDVFAGGTVKILDGTGYGESHAVSSNTGTTLTIADTWTANPDTSSYFIVIDTCGNVGNPPNNFWDLITFGGYYWGYEYGTNYLHFWAESDGSDAEGDGTTDAAVVQVGPPGVPIIGMQVYNNQLWVFREDGAWTVSEDNLAYHALPFATEVSNLNFATSVIFNGFLVFPIRNTLYKYTSGLANITPPVWDEYPPYKKFGNFKGLTVRGSFMYVMAQSNEANTNETYEGTTGFVSILATDGVGWHKLLSTTDTTPSDYNMWLDPVYDRIYYWTLDSGGTGQLRYIQLQTLSDLPYSVYSTSEISNWYSSYFDLGMERVPKSWASLTLSGDFPTGTSVYAYFRTDDTTSWTYIGIFDSDMEEIDLPSGTEGKKIQFKLRLKTTTATNSPWIKHIIMKVMIRPEVLYGVHCDIIVATDVLDQNRHKIGLTGPQVRTALKSARDSVSPITLEDIQGVSGSCYLASLQFMTMGYVDSNDVQYIARCTFIYV